MGFVSRTREAENCNEIIAKFQKKCSEVQNCNLRKFHDLHDKLSRVLFYRGIDESRDRFKHLWKANPAVK